jgi:hypothetical protein
MYYIIIVSLDIAIESKKLSNTKGKSIEGFIQEWNRKIDSDEKKQYEFRKEINNEIS